MGHTRTPAFQLQVPAPSGGHYIEGADSIKEAIKELLTLQQANLMQGNEAFLWPQTASGRDRIGGHGGADYISITIKEGLAELNYIKRVVEECKESPCPVNDCYDGWHLRKVIVK